MMPKVQYNLTEQEVKIACVYWVKNGSPMEAYGSAYLSVDRPENASQFDPGNGITAEVTLLKGARNDR
jgi:hypothetical protein